MFFAFVISAHVESTSAEWKGLGLITANLFNNNSIFAISVFIEIGFLPPPKLIIS